MGEVTDPAILAQLNATGDDFLKTLPADRASQVKALSEGRLQLPSGYSLRSKAGQELLSDVAQYDPSFDVANAGARVATRKAFTSGKQGQNITALNTGISHAGTLAQAAEELDNTSFPIWNSIANGVESATGDPRVTNFNLVKQAAIDEAQRVFKGTGGNLHEIEQWEKTLNSSRSPAQLRGAIGQLAELYKGRIDALEDSYNSGMGTVNQGLPLLDPHARDTLAQFQSPDYLQHGYYGAATRGGGDAGGTPPANQAPPAGGNPNPSPWDNPDVQKVALSSDGSRDFYTQRDKDLSAAAQALIEDPKSTRADFDRLGAQYGGYTFGEDLDRALEYRKAHPGAKINVSSTMSGHEDGSLLQKVVGSTVGAPIAAAGIQAADPFGVNNKIIAGVDALGSRLGGDQRSVGDIYNQNLIENNLKTDLAEQAHPYASLAGQVGGFIAGDAALGRGLRAVGQAIPGAAALAGRAIPQGARAIAQDAAYGAAYGAGSSDNLSDVPRNVLEGAGLSAGGGVLGRGIARGVAGVLTPAVDAGVRRLTDAGITLTPGQILGAGGGRVSNAIKATEDRLAGFPVVGDAIQGARRTGVEDFNRAAINDALAPIGQQADGIGHAGVADAQAKVSQAYDDALSRMTAVPDQQLTADLSAAQQGAQRLSESHRTQFQNIMDTDIQPYVAGRQQLNGTDLQSIKQGLDGEISNLRGQGSSPQDRNLADRLEDVRNSFMDLAARTSPEAASDFQRANQSYALLARIEDAASKTKDGVYTPNQFRTAVGRKGYGTTRRNLASGSAPFQQLSTDASTILPSSIPDSGTAGRAALGHFVGLSGGSALGAGTGYYEGGNEGALLGAGIGALAFSRPGLRTAQNVLAGNRGRTLTTLGDVIRANASLGGAVGTPILLDKLPE